MSIIAALFSLVCAMGISCPDYVSPVVIIESDSGHGSGVFISDNVVMTAGHVIEGARRGKNARIRLASGETFNIEMTVIDPEMDIGILTVDHPFKGRVPQIDCDHLERGTALVNVGNPRNMEFIQQNVTVAGGDSGIDDEDKNGLVLYQGISIPGLSGSPMYTLDGRVVGVLDLMFADDSGRLGIGGYVSLEYACQFVKNNLPKEVSLLDRFIL